MPRSKTINQPVKLSKEQRQRQAAIAEMNPALRKIHDRIVESEQQAAKSHLQVIYQNGKIFAEVKENPDTRYGDNAHKILATALGRDWGEMYRAAKLAEWLDERRIETTTLTFEHMRALLTLHDEEERNKLMDKAEEKGWSCTELAATIRSAKGMTPRTPHTGPRTWMGWLGHIGSSATEMERTLSEDFFEKLVKPVHDLPDDKLNDTLLSSIDATNGQLIKARDEIDAKIAALQELREEVSVKMDTIAQGAGNTTPPPVAPPVPPAAPIDPKAKKVGRTSRPIPTA